jgi:hypothetical protein
MALKPIKTPAEGQAPLQFIVGGSMGADYTSEGVDVSLVDDVSIQLNFAGTAPTGNFYVQASLDNVVYTALELVDEEGAPWVPAAAGDGTILINLSPIPFPYLKVFFDRTSGTGTLEGYIYGK